MSSESNPKLNVTAVGGERSIDLRAGDERERLTRILRREGLGLNTRCGEKGICDGCVLSLTAGRLVHRETGDVVESTGDPVTLHGCEYSPSPGGDLIALRIPQRSLLAHVPQVVSNFKLKIPWAQDPLWQGERSGVDRPLGVAVDIGTTTVAILLVDLSNGRILAKNARYNEQAEHGDNVLTRINLCSTDPSMLGELQQCVTQKTLRPLVEQALAKAEADARQVVCYAVAGNTTMLHLFAGVDPSPMGVSPFTPNFTDHRVLSSVELNLPGEAEVHLLPSAAAYVGADLVAGCLATGQAYDEGPTLLVDVGTNGEIILKHGEHLTGCATAAGPAFEGAGLSSGMRAADGAIEHVAIATDDHRAITVEVIGAVEPTGICGSAYMDLLAAGRRSGLLNLVGRFAAEHPQIVSKNSAGRLLRLAGEGESFVGISEADVASLLQAKAAIAAGIVTLLERIGLEPADVGKLYLAGGFGMHLAVDSAIGAGLLPGFTADQVEAVGNTSLGGAYIALQDRTILDEMKHIAARIDVIELNLEPSFEMQFVEQMSLP